MIVTQDGDLSERARYLTTQATDDSFNYIHNEVGFNYRMTNIQAAIGCAQLEKIESYIEKKRDNFALYEETLINEDGLRLIVEPEYASSNHWFYTLSVDPKRRRIKAKELLAKLNGVDIGARPIWELNHRQEPYKCCQFYKIEKALKYHKMCVNLPCSVSLTSGDIKQIVNCIRGSQK
jgi:perosamine synthetase